MKPPLPRSKRSEKFCSEYFGRKIERQSDCCLDESRLLLGEKDQSWTMLYVSTASDRDFASSFKLFSSQVTYSVIRGAKWQWEVFGENCAFVR